MVTVLTVALSGSVGAGAAESLRTPQASSGRATGGPAADGLALRLSHGPGDESGSGVSGFSTLSGSVVQSPTAAEESGGSWHIEVVDSGGDVTEYTSLALDASGYPHITYVHAANYDLRYAYRDASGWHIQTVDNGERAGLFSSLALDQSGYPHISYHEQANHTLKYAYQDGAGWHIQTVDSERYAGYYTSLALDGNGYPHIAYLDLSNWDLRYAYRDTYGWHIQTVDSEGDVGGWPSLALDKSGYPHISYYDGTNKSLKYARRDGAGWYVQTVDNEPYVGWDTSIALDESDYPHISHHDNVSSDLKYAYRDASGWHNETVDSKGHVGRYSSLALDEGDYPHVSYSDSSNDDLKYTYRDASGWHIQTADSEGDVGMHTSLALDGDGYPHISYYDEVSGDLKYAVGPPPAPTLYAVSNADGDGDYTVTWSSAADADTYTLQEDDNDSFSSPTTRHAGSATAYAVDGQSPGTWYYRVKASAGARESTWSNVESVTVRPDPPTLYAVDNPDGDGDYTVDWSSVTGADTYTLQEDDDEGFTSPTTRYTGSSSQYTISGQDPGVWYYRVKASNAGGDSGWSNVESVTVEHARVTAFTGSPISGPGPLTVDFTDQSTGSITEWSWDFGDGATSNVQNPSHTYDAAGDYTVSLTVSGPGGSDTETKTDYVHVTEPTQGDIFVYLPLVLRRWPPPPETPTLYAISNGADGSYTVSWSTAARATSYVLQEAAKATTPAGSDFATVYAGANTSYDFNGRGAARYHYRVKARNSSGDSGWSNVERVDVLWETEPNGQEKDPTNANGPLVSGTTYRGYPNDPDDYFFFELSSQATVEVLVEQFAPTSSNGTVSLYGPAVGGKRGKLIDYYGEPGDASMALEPHTLGPGTYYVRVYTAGNHSTTQAYRLTVTY